MYATPAFVPSASPASSSRTIAVVCGCPMMTPMGWFYVWQTVVYEEAPAALAPFHRAHEHN